VCVCAGCNGGGHPSGHKPVFALAAVAASWSNELAAEREREWLAFFKMCSAVAYLQTRPQAEPERRERASRASP
jgi:hypothetical protein